ncbi:MAG: NUDIX domain-containing protein [Patescibacteria group bacterium]
MTSPTLLIAASGSDALVACQYDRRIALAKLTLHVQRDSRLLAAVARVAPPPRLHELRLIVVAVHVPSFSQTRALLTTANALSAVVGCPVVQVPVTGGVLDAHALITAGLAAARKPHPRWAAPHYLAKPNITKPGKQVAEYHTTAGGIVYDRSQDAFLFIQRLDSKRIGLPKGHQEKGETLIETAKREIAEETGITNLTFLATLDSITFRFAEQAKLHEKKQHNFLFLRGSKATVKRSATSEVRNLKNLWLNPERAQKNGHIYPDLLPIIRRAADILHRRGLRKA